MHTPRTQLTVEPLGPAGQASQRSPHVAGSLLLTHALLHRCWPFGQLGAHWPPLHETLPPSGTGHGVQRSPQVAAALFDTHWLLQVCVPAGQVEPQTVPLQVALPPAGAGHGLPQRPPQLLTSLLLTHWPLHR
jgi:hypothetical protein